MSSDAKLVYSSDPSLNKKCPKCKNLIPECSCREEAPRSQITAVMRIEKQGRGGSTVTVVDRLPKQEKFLKDLASDLKKKCGSGGTYRLDGKDGIVEVQGDKRELIRKVLESKGMKVKG